MKIYSNLHTEFYLHRQNSIKRVKVFVVLITLILGSTVKSYSKNFYFSSSAGNDSYTATQAQNPATPWRTVDKLNSSMNLIIPGDSILFKRGDTFTGQITLTRSGTATARIVFSAYGAGNLPMIKGTIPVTGWTHYSGNIWQADCPELGSTVTNFFINGKSQQIGRYPNTDAPNRGYLNIDSHVGSTSVTSSSLLSTPNWTGGEAVVRTRRWKLDRVSIQSHSGNTLSFGNPTTFEICNNYGFFIQNHLNTLDELGEWYYNATEKKIYLFHPNDPNFLQTEATVFAKIFEAVTKQYFLIENIEFKGGLNTNILISNSDYIILKSNIFSDAGNDAVLIIDCSNIDFINNTIIRTNNNSLRFQRTRNVIMQNNVIRSTGLLPGMSTSTQQFIGSPLQFIGLIIEGSNNVRCESNSIDSVGHNGVLYRGDTILIKNNIIANFCMTIDDGAGLYTAGNGTSRSYNRVLENNIVYNGIGSGYGTDYPNFKSAEGIYLDDRTNNVNILGNTVFNCAGYGIYLHNSNNFSLINNTVYNNTVQLTFIHDNIAPDFPITNCLVENNIFFSKSETQLVAYFSTIKDDIYNFGVFDHNYYCRPLNDNFTIEVKYSGNSGTITDLIDLSKWQKSYNFDLNSTISPFKIPAYILLNYVGTNKITNGVFETDISGWEYWSNYGNGKASWQNNPSLNNGCLKLNFEDASGKTDGYMLGSTQCGEIIEGKNYILKFSMISSQPEKKVKIRILKGSYPFNNTVSDQLILVGTTRNEYNLLFVPDTSETNARVYFEIEESDANYWIDNVELYYANIQNTDIDNSILFVYNPTNSALVINNTNKYVDVKGSKYTGKITLLPFTSNIFLADPDPSDPPPCPVYVSAVIENTTPARIAMTYDLSLANIVPLASAFTVMVNSIARTVTSVSISGTKVLLTLASPAAYGDVITIGYTKPTLNPLQTTSGGQAATISAQNVTNSIAAPAVPVYVSSAIENSDPSILEMTYSLTLANIVPATSAFTVMVNSIARTVTSVSISGTKVLLTLVSPAAYGDVITIGYTKPTTNPLQTTSGGQAAAISAQNITNSVAAPAVVVYVSSSIGNSASSILEMTYSLILANIVPATSAFSVMVNSIARIVSSVSISGTKVLLTLVSPAAYGDVITVGYTKPTPNPLQTTSGGQAATISAQTVINRIAAINAAPVVVVNYPQTSYSGFVNEISAEGSYDTNNDNLSFTWSAPVSVPISSTSGATIKFLGPIVSESQTVEFTVRVSDGKTNQSQVIPIEILPYKPEQEAAEVLSVEANGFQSPNYPQNIIDGNIGTMWSSNGYDQWLIIELRQLFSIQHVTLAFHPGQRRESYFDVLGSDDKETWEPILTKSASCDFSGDLQVFDFPQSKARKEFKYVKLVGQGNSIDAGNYISELKIFGYKCSKPSFYENLAIKLYPNPANEFINIRIDEPTLSFDFIRIIQFSGEVVYNGKVILSERQFQIPINLINGIYSVQMGRNNVTLFSQKLIIVNK